MPRKDSVHALVHGGDRRRTAKRAAFACCQLPGDRLTTTNGRQPHRIVDTARCIWKSQGLYHWRHELHTWERGAPMLAIRKPRWIVRVGHIGAGEEFLPVHPKRYPAKTPIRAPVVALMKTDSNNIVYDSPSEVP